MHDEALEEIQLVCDRLHDLAGTYPDFRYVELSGAALADERLPRAAMAAIAAGAEYHCEYRPDHLRVLGVYGPDLDAAIASLQAVADEIWLTVRRVERHFQLDDAAVRDEMPAAREYGIPFVLLDILVHLAIEFPIALAEAVTELGGALPDRPGKMVMYEGAVEVKHRCLVLPGSTYIPPGGCMTRDYTRVVGAARRGEFFALHSLHPAFALLSAFFDSCLTLSKAPRQVELPPSHGAQGLQPRVAGELITPSEQATMLGWKEPASVPTLKRIAQLRRAVLTRGMPLDEQKVLGRGNKMLVPRDQWESVVTLLGFVAASAGDDDEAITAIGRGVRLTNSTGELVSYRCDHCGEITRTKAMSPECGHCNKFDRLRPLTTPRGK